MSDIHNVICIILPNVNCIVDKTNDLINMYCDIHYISDPINYDNNVLLIVISLIS